MINSKVMEKVFVYGTLRDKKIRTRVTGREIPAGNPDKLEGFTLSTTVDEGMCYPIITKEPESTEKVEGELIEVTPEELKHMDNYEGDLYRRLKVKTASGDEAWVYCR